MGGVILVSGAGIALAAQHQQARACLKGAIRNRAIVVIPTVVIAETTHGTARDAAINRIINGVEVIAPVTEAIARLAGKLLAATDRRNVTIDALVAAEAILGRPSVIMTGDAEDISALIAGYPLVRIRPI